MTGSVGHGTRCEITSLWPSDTELRGLASGKHAIIIRVITIIHSLYFNCFFIFQFTFVYSLVLLNIKMTGLRVVLI